MSTATPRPPTLPRHAPKVLDHSRLDASVEMPFGTVLADVNGIEHVFVGTKTSPAGQVFYFMPRVDRFRGMPPLVQFSLLAGALAKFPGLAQHLSSKLGVPAASVAEPADDAIVIPAGTAARRPGAGGLAP